MGRGREKGAEVREGVERGYAVPSRAYVRDCVHTRARFRYVCADRRMVHFQLVSVRSQSCTAIPNRFGFGTSNSIRFGVGFRASIPIRLGLICRRTGDYTQNTGKTTAVARGAPIDPIRNHFSDDCAQAYQASGTP